VSADQLIAARVSSDTKLRLRAYAEREQLTESAILKRFVLLLLQKANDGVSEETIEAARPVRDGRVTIRLRGDDLMLLQARATARGMPAAAYVSVLTRSHLRNLAPLPKEELLALNGAVSELGRIGRLLNPIARAAHQGERVSDPSREDLLALLKVCVALRDHVKGLLRANLATWRQGYTETVNE
jgi:predicted DNA binding CopG/RHH family protein